MLAEIVAGVQALTDKVQTVSAAAEEINAQTGEVVGLVESVVSVAEENAQSAQSVSTATARQTEGMEGIGASAHNLSELAAGLNELLGRFKME